MSISSIKKNADDIYLNVVINHDPTYGSFDSPAVYNSAKTTAVIDNPADYFCSIVRFTIPLQSIPIFIMPIVPNQGNPNLTPMVISISYHGSTFSTNVIYNPANPLQAPNQNQTTQIITPYYYVYSAQNLIDSINTAIKVVYAAFAAAFPGPIPPQVTSNFAPFFYFDATTQLITLITPSSWAITGADQALLIVNNYLLNYLPAFDMIDIGNGNYAFNIQYRFNNAAAIPFGTTPTNPPDYIYMQQEFQAMAQWISLRKIVIASSTLPVRNEIVPVINPDGTQSDSSISYPIFSDFVPAISTLGDVRSVAYYVPTSQYRLVDLIGNSPIYNIDLKVSWEDKLGNLYPLYVSVFQQMSFKIAFLHKSLYKGTQTLQKIM
jgi:hypothetical protein